MKNAKSTAAKNFKVTATASGITIASGSSKVSLKIVDGEPVREHVNVEGKDRQYGMHITNFIKQVLATNKLKKLAVADRINAIADVFKAVADSASFRNLSNRARKHAEETKLTAEGQFFFEVNRG